MNHKYFGQPRLDKEVHALLGILKLKSIGSFDEQGSKFKKSLFQTRVLERIYEITNFPSPRTRKDIALLLKMPEKSVQVWFQNSRQADRRASIAQGGHLLPDLVEISVIQLLEIIKSVKLNFKNENKI